MENRENEFLKNTFKQYEVKASLDADFNKSVLNKIELNTAKRAGLNKYLKIILPVLIILLVVSFILITSYGKQIFIYLNELIPTLKPWHAVVAIILTYFHFIRSLLILGFLYFKKQFNFVVFLNPLAVN